jgi:hypothetical protein
MKIIKKTISLEPITSRVPSIWPAYKNNKLYFFDDISLKNREYEYPTNYGMIPLSLSLLSSVTESGTEYAINCGNENAIIISFERLCYIYSFFKKYNYLLNKAGHCGHVYSSAIEYYNTEIDNKYADVLEYGTDEEIYVNLDNNFAKYGGNDFYKWIITNIIPTYYISDEYKEYWNRDVLYYSDVIKWVSWFKDRTHYETEARYVGKTEIDTEHWDCKSNNTIDCCDCEEYFKRGGIREMNSMLEWYNAVQENIVKINHVVLNENNAVLHCFEPNVITNVELVNSLENIGQYSVLSPEYALGIDYRVADAYGASANTKGGTTVIDESGNTRILKDGEKGFCFSPFYMEKIFDDNSWDNYITRYINSEPQEFVSNLYKYYAFDDENKFYSGNTRDEVISAMSTGKVYNVTQTDSILIDGTLVPIETSEYGIYDLGNSILGGRTYFVYREKNTSTPYTLINGKKIYAESYFSLSGMCYYFSFFKNLNYKENKEGKCNKISNFDIDKYKIFGRKKNNDDLINYISYNDKTHIINDTICMNVDMPCNSAITINDISYYRVKGYSSDEYGNMMYVINDTNKIYNDKLIELPSTYALSEDNSKIYLNVYNNNVIIYDAKCITGRTISKLLDLASINKLCDDTGNDIDGIYNDTCREINGQSSAMTYAQPPIYTVLEPIYQVGNTSLIARFKLTKENISDIEDNKNYFIGNIITKMKFYYKDVNGNKVESTIFECGENMTSLSAISESTFAKNQIDEEDLAIIFDENLYCDIEYYIGATLERRSGTNFKLADGYNYGVKYNETVKFVKTPVFYRLKMEEDENEIMPTQAYETENLSHKYMIYTYIMKQDVEEVESNIYDTAFQVPMANFTSEINLIDSNITPNFSGYSDMDDYNGMDISPVYKEEYKLGLAMNENVDADIYIDRGINAAFEKHLKLQEITSLEALVQYGNNYFKIMDS